MANGGDETKTDDPQNTTGNNKKPCKDGMKCQHVKNGNCKFGHPACKDGVNCKKVKQRNCGFYHPKAHFSAVKDIHYILFRLSQSLITNNHNTHEITGKTEE